MLAEIAAQHPEVVATFAEASAGAGIDLGQLAQQGPEARLNRTEHTQPALLAAGIAVWRVWNKLGGAQPALLAGHSLGEYTALVAAGALDLAEAAALVAERGRLMQEAVPEGEGAMAAVLGGDDALIAEVCAEVAEGQVVAPANFNAPGQTVIAGQADAVARALARLAERGVRKSVCLPVSVPSHCELMREAAARLAERMASVSWRMPQVCCRMSRRAPTAASSTFARRWSASCTCRCAGASRCRCWPRRASRASPSADRARYWPD